MTHCSSRENGLAGSRQKRHRIPTRSPIRRNGRTPPADAARRLRTGHPLHRTAQRLGHQTRQRGLADTGIPETTIPPTSPCPTRAEWIAANAVSRCHDRPRVHHFGNPGLTGAGRVGPVIQIELNDRIPRPAHARGGYLAPAASPDAYQLGCCSSQYVVMREIVLIKYGFRNRREARFHSRREGFPIRRVNNPGVRSATKPTTRIGSSALAVVRRSDAKLRGPVVSTPRPVLRAIFRSGTGAAALGAVETGKLAPRVRPGRRIYP